MAANGDRSKYFGTNIRGQNIPTKKISEKLSPYLWYNILNYKYLSKTKTKKFIKT